jgi:hypothetical protein
VAAALSGKKRRRKAPALPEGGAKRVRLTGAAAAAASEAKRREAAAQVTATAQNAGQRLSLSRTLLRGVEDDARTVSGSEARKQRSIALSVRYAHGSIAEKMLMHWDEQLELLTQSGAPGVDTLETTDLLPEYGVRLVRFALNTITGKDRDTATAIFADMLTHASARAIFRDKHERARDEAARHVDAYVHACIVDRQILPARDFVAQLTWIHHAPLLPVSLMLSASERAPGGLAEQDRRASAYISEAMLTLWKIIECTP